MHLDKLKTTIVTAAILGTALAAGVLGFHVRAGDGPAPDDFPVPAQQRTRAALSEQPEVKPAAKQENVTMSVSLPTGVLGSCAFLDNDRVLVSPGTSDGLDIRDVKTGKVLKTISVDKHVFGGFRVSADRKWVAGEVYSALGNGKGIPFLEITVWDTATWKVHGTLTSCLRLLDVGADGRTVAVVRKEGVEVWDVVAKKKVKSAPFTFDRIDAARFSPDGKLLVVSGTNEIEYRKWRDGDTHERLKVGRVIQSLAFSPDGKLLAEGPAHEGTVEVRDLTTLKVTRSFKGDENPGVPQDVKALTFADAGKVLVVVNTVGVVGTTPVPHRVHVWDVKTGKLKRQLAFEAGTPRLLDVSPDGKTLAVIIEDQNKHTLVTWNGNPSAD